MIDHPIRSILRGDNYDVLIPIGHPVYRQELFANRAVDSRLEFLIPDCGIDIRKASLPGEAGARSCLEVRQIQRDEFTKGFVETHRIPLLHNTF